MSAIERIRAAAAKTNQSLGASTPQMGNEDSDSDSDSSRSQSYDPSSSVHHPSSSQTNAALQRDKDERDDDEEEGDEDHQPVNHDDSYSTDGGSSILSGVDSITDEDGLINGELKNVELLPDEIVAFKNAFSHNGDNNNHDHHNNDNDDDGNGHVSDDGQSVGSSQTGVSSLGAMHEARGGQDDYLDDESDGQSIQSQESQISHQENVGHGQLKEQQQQNNINENNDENNTDVSDEDESGSESGSESESDDDGFDWVEGFDKNHQLYYYFNKHTQESRWEKPPEGYKPHDPNEESGSEESGSEEEDSEDEGE
mmetsp:Transcript_25045/g.29623  ORF Transcript_25045/g.29623 Transcript_25045/m.29623 type:complete len:312 (-) Transcript_25045:214-1149(-)